MTNAKKKVEEARILFGIASACLGVAGFAMESWLVSGFALFCALAWLILCIVSLNMKMDEQIERAAPRKGSHRRNS